MPILCIAGIKGKEKWISVCHGMNKCMQVWPWGEFEIYFVLFSTIRLKSEGNLLIIDFLEVFYFPSDFIGI